MPETDFRVVQFKTKCMMRLFSLLVAMQLCSIAAICNANAQTLGMPPKDFVHFLQKHFDEHSGAFVGSCLLRQPMAKGVLTFMEYVVLPRSSITGYLVEITQRSPQGGPVVDNVAQLSIKTGRIEISDNMGGIWTGQTLRRAASDILSRPMQFEASFDDALALQDRFSPC